ncbi:MAG: hypothetical protein LIO96_03115 [Lachnospiraceae bacterium]|nr:hypothetical protein [Lachnospiraceae bacterium]
MERSSRATVFFESFQRYLLDTFDLKALDQTLCYLAPTFRFLADPAHWEPGEFTSDDMFAAVLHLQKMGVFRVMKTKPQIPGEGDRFFEYYQRILVEKVGVETMDRLLAILAQCIRFLASEEAMENVVKDAAIDGSSVPDTGLLCSGVTANS